MSLPRITIEKFANGWTVKVNVDGGKFDKKDYEYIATEMNDLLNIIECVSDGNLSLEKDYEPE